MITRISSRLLSGWPVLFGLLLTQVNAGAQPRDVGRLVLDRWSYIQVDDSRQKWGDWNPPQWLRSFGIAMADATSDGFQDIAAGRYFYRNPGGDMTGAWKRTDFGLNVDAFAFVEVDGDSQADVIAQALPNVYWLEANDGLGSSWTATVVAQVPPTDHVNGQGYASAQIVPGGKPEIVLSTDGVYYLQIPDKPFLASWPAVRIASKTMGEGIGVGDVDRDGLVDVVAGSQLADKSFRLDWYWNPGDGSPDWRAYVISTHTTIPDRIAVADFNGDGRLDVAVSEERYPGKQPDAGLYWFEQPETAGDREWIRHDLITEFSLNNLGAADLDHDGDIDLVTNEHKGELHQTQIFENDGKGKFSMRVLDTGKEMHLGCVLSDLDGDGDLDMAGVPWDDYRYLHVWRNDARANPRAVHWQQKTSMINRQIPLANVGRQSALVVFDIDKDGREDITVAGWDDPSLVWLRLRPDGGWDRYILDDRKSHIEAGGAVFDIDGDGDLDLLHGGSWATNEVWWWENPAPDFEPRTPWKRHTIKSDGAKQHHDQIFGDFDGDGRTELVFWNQAARKLLLAEIPDHPEDQAAWKFDEIWSWPMEFKYEGLAKADIDLDGVEDLIGGGYWFKYESPSVFTANQIDDYGSSRSAAGDLIKGGRPEVVLCSGDTIGPLNLYEWKDNRWGKTTLIQTVRHGHTLEIADLNGDGNLDIYTGEMHTPGAGDECRQWVLYGNGEGGFTQQIVSIGIGTHQGKLGDVDGDGDLDIVQKDFQHQRRTDVWLNTSKP